MTNENSNATTPESTSAKLQAMARDAAIRTKYARFLDLVCDVEAALSAGVQQKHVRLQLVEDGLDLTEATFKTYLQRARSEHAKRGAQKSTALKNPPPERQQEPETESKEQQGDDESRWNPQAIAGLRHKPVDLAALARFAKETRKGNTKK